METIKTFDINHVHELTMLEVAIDVRRSISNRLGKKIDELDFTLENDGTIKITVATSGPTRYDFELSNHESESRVLDFLKRTGMDCTTKEIIENVFAGQPYHKMITPVGGTLYRLWQQNLITKSGNKRDRKWCYNFGVIKLKLNQTMASK